ncbi:MAG: hypothetical protein EXR71_11145 [Myxococcales bacterium]|nr:hypothetical protein [Myxococcales bacterium]
MCSAHHWGGRVADRRRRQVLGRARVKRGILLVNVGSPDAPSTVTVREYLARFLSDPRILGMPAWVRLPLVHGLIAPLRAPKSAAAYGKIWTTAGSPLTVYGEGLAAAVGGVYATRCGRPSLAASLDRQGDVDEVVGLPLHPHYAAATTAPTMDALGEGLANRVRVPAVHVVPPFWANPDFLDAVAAVARPGTPGRLTCDIEPHGLAALRGPVAGTKVGRASSRADGSGNGCDADNDGAVSSTAATRARARPRAPPPPPPTPRPPVTALSPVNPESPHGPRPAPRLPSRSGSRRAAVRHAAPRRRPTLCGRGADRRHPHHRGNLPGPRRRQPVRRVRRRPGHDQRAVHRTLRRH